jgi:hypothetical protein
MNVHWRISTNGSKGKPEGKFDAAFGIKIELLIVFKEAIAETVYLFFSSKRQAKNFKAICACIESTDLI